MNTHRLLCWNARGLSCRARRDAVRSIVRSNKASIVCLQESKTENFTVTMNLEISGFDFDYAALPSVGAAGGIVVAWRRDMWTGSAISIRRFSISLLLTPCSGVGEAWWLTTVYGPTDRRLKAEFLQELRDARTACTGPWIVAGDFNLIYLNSDKNNARLHRGQMRMFRSFIDALQLQEIVLEGRSYTWSNGRDSPTLERLDRIFMSVEWAQGFPKHLLRCLSSDASDHAPLLLLLDADGWGRPRFQFGSHWPRLPGFVDVISIAWNMDCTSLDACRAFDTRLRNVARALSSWLATCVGSVRMQLAAARVVIFELERAQESRQLSAGELVLLRDLKGSSLGLASLDRTMARQRARERHLREADACTKYFHLQACHRRRKNFIPSLQHDGRTILDEPAKADLVHDHYVSILGTPFTRLHRINLQLLDIPRLDDLHCLADPFSPEEVRRIVWESPLDRAPGPDGMSTAFYRASWEIVGPDLAALFDRFWELDFRSLHSINGALMVLLRKNGQPTSIKDYRPISLIHSVGKFISKGLALRLTPYMTRIVRLNQSAFIRGRLLHDNFRAVQLTCRWLHARRYPTILLKVDLAKAFDTVAWPFLLDVLRHIGFPLRWTNWVSALLASSSTRVLVNGRAGARIRHARGLRQGDPLSPLLFVIIMEVLNALLAEADRRGELTPMPGQCIKHRVSLYADDLVVFLAPSARDFMCVRDILDLFAGASGLATNVQKCTISPIRCSQQSIDEVLAVFPCAQTDFPTRYLGAPLGPGRLRRADEQAIVDKVAARIPTWKAGLLTQAGRTTLTKTTLSAIPIHVAICCCLSAKAIADIDKHRRAFIWTGTSSVAGGKCKVAWPIVCSPKECAGLGVTDLTILGYALRLRWEWKRRTQPDAVWEGLPSRPERRVEQMFRASVTVAVGDGASALFWTDSWRPDGPISSSSPNLYNAVPPRRRKRTVRDALADNQWCRDITGAPTAQVLVEYVNLWDELVNFSLDPLVPDRFIWRWTADGLYSASSAYRAFFVGHTSLPGARELWRASAPPKIKFFFWLALHGRLWTAERRMRHGLQPRGTCILCDQEDETTDHLLLGCVFSRQVWCILLGRAGLQVLMPAPGSRLADWWLSSRLAVPAAARKAFDSTVLAVSWALWRERNARTFNNLERTIPAMVAAITADLSELFSAGFRGLAALLVFA